MGSRGEGVVEDNVQRKNQMVKKHMTIESCSISGHYQYTAACNALH